MFPLEKHADVDFSVIRHHHRLLRNKASFSLGNEALQVIIFSIQYLVESKCCPLVIESVESPPSFRG